MLTRNFKQSVLSRYGDTASYVKLTDGTQLQAGNVKIIAHVNIGGTGSACSLSMRIGSGSTPPSYEDYCLESPIDITPSSVTLLRNTNYTEGSSIVTAVFVNNSENEITVSESALSYGTGSATSETRAYVVAREVFDPIVVPVGSSVTITMTIN